MRYLEMMNKTQFSELINYIKNRPAEAERLRVALGMAIGEGGRSDEALSGGQPQWMTVSQVGDRLGRSGSWVLKQLPLLPKSAKKQSEGARRTWFIDFSAAGGQLADIMTR